MGDNTGTIPPGATGWPPPRSNAIRLLSFAFGAGAAIAGFLGFCTLAGILALLSLLFNLWDFFQDRGSGTPGPRSGGGDPGYSGTGTSGPSTSGGSTGTPGRY
jgi:hypothetical protein